MGVGRIAGLASPQNREIPCNRQDALSVAQNQAFQTPAYDQTRLQQPTVTFGASD